LQAAHRLWPAVAALGAVAIFATELVRPEIYRALLHRPWAWPLALLAAVGLGVAMTKRDRTGFLGSCAFLGSR
jgi:hypothetical protein